MNKPTVHGKLTIDLSQVDDHFSLMELFKRAVVKTWGTRYSKFKECEFWEMLQEYMEYCPKRFRFSSELERTLNEMPDHFCRRGKKKEYSLMIVKDKNGKWQVLYANLDAMTLDSFSDDKNYSSLLDALQKCKTFLTTRNWKK